VVKGRPVQDDDEYCECDCMCEEGLPVVDAVLVVLLSLLFASILTGGWGWLNG
jgi:hypothetical protein